MILLEKIGAGDEIRTHDPNLGKLEVTFKNGVLTIKLPKSPETTAKTQKIATTVG